MKHLTDKEFAWLQKLEKEIDKAWDQLTRWERNFIENILERFRRYGKNTSVSAGQWQVITEISEKIIE